MQFWHSSGSSWSRMLPTRDQSSSTVRSLAARSRALSLAKGLLDEVEVGRVRPEDQQSGAARRDRCADRRLLDGKVVQDDAIAWPQQGSFTHVTQLR